MPIEETAWDVLVSREIEARQYEQLRAALAEMIAERLPSNKRLRRIVAWSPDGGCLFRPRQNPRQYAVSYEVEVTI